MIQRILLVVWIGLFISCKEEVKLQPNYLKGKALGTTFSLQYFDQEQKDYRASFDSLIQVINISLSTYQDDSDISRINAGDTTVVIDEHFQKVFNASKKIHKETSGAFDPTIGVLVNAWDFGPKGEIQGLDSLKIDSLLGTVGLDKVHYKQGKIHKEHTDTFLDFNALAKGYTVDVFAMFLEQEGYTDYLVEIGGEIRTKGYNVAKNKPWKIGVEEPNFDGTQSYNKVISLKTEAMATSGSYRKYKVDKEGNRYAHIIDTKTGYPHKSNLLSVSILANTCMEADAYATALTSMGVQQSIEFLTQHPELRALLIYEKGGALKTEAFNGFPEN
ncbi:FAD:protein FMN transferase [Aquimarina hainanensis]|uniref:FAD:protein FMN transferase n=1 Tax=Aquimarina hainanensis TaxID=1578017 RepID=A0ABW5N7F3_9FLAO